MEILIIGLLLVALMVFVSTKIKTSAARAFESEIIERDEFKIVKPEGLMSPLDENSKYPFEARSREFGSEKNWRNVWQAHAFLTVDEGLKFKAKCDEARRAADKILSEKTFNENDGEKVCLIESEKTENEVPLIEFRKIVESRKRKKTYDLQISVLRPLREVYIHKINDMTNSFRLK
jgi:hypothetical protein